MACALNYHYSLHCNSHNMVRTLLNQIKLKLFEFWPRHNSRNQELEWFVPNSFSRWTEASELTRLAEARISDNRLLDISIFSLEPRFEP